mmetsp:Transcript_9550/g.20647  ORF Transcript_9550/g.20647 Transcript_9550/m.20647 type:complete len:634 (-) Transcript_9550:212-2113(-)
MGAQKRMRRCKMVPSPVVVTLALALTTRTSPSTPGLLPQSSFPVMMPAASAFSFQSFHTRATIHTKLIQLSSPKKTKTTTICNAKLNKIASNFDLDEILSNEKAFDNDDDGGGGSSEEETSSAKTKKKKKKGRGRKKDDKKMKMKEQLKKQKLEKQQAKKKQNENTGQNSNEFSSSGENNISDGESESIDHQQQIQTIDFLAYEIPSSLDGKRIDATLAELLNKEDGSVSSNPVSISRSQCETLLSNECVFIVPPEEATAFRSAWNAETTTTVPHSLFEPYSSPIQRKSHPLESSSILIYPSRQSLLATSSSSVVSSTLLSNFIPPTEIIAQKLPLNILYEDEHMIVLNKQAGMVVHPAAGNWDGTVVNALAYYLMNESPYGAGEFFTDDDDKTTEEEEEHSPSSSINLSNDDAELNQNDAVTNSISTLRPGIVHRLDKGTTGVLVVAKTSSSLATLSEAFAERKVKKQYLAIAIGNPGEDQWINKPIGRHPLHRQRMRVVPDPSSSVNARNQARLTGPKPTKPGRPALSHIHTVHYDGKLSVVEVQIATGRTHQIRVHLQDHGTPIYGDDVYGLSDWNKALSSRRGIVRPLLHAQRLEIDHPVTGESMVFEAEVAEDMMGVMKAIMPVETVL